jgi:hypothetical protein
MPAALGAVERICEVLEADAQFGSFTLDGHAVISKTSSSLIA